MYKNVFGSPPSQTDGQTDRQNPSHPFVAKLTELLMFLGRRVLGRGTPKFLTQIIIRVTAEMWQSLVTVCPERDPTDDSVSTSAADCL